MKLSILIVPCLYDLACTFIFESKYFCISVFTDV